MKKIVLAILITLSPMIAKDEVKQVENPFLNNDHFPGGYFLMADSLPHFMGVYMKHGGMQKIKPTPEQEEVIEKLFERMVQTIMKSANETKVLETKLVLAVVNNGKNAKDVHDSLDKIAKNRRDLTVLQIECLNTFKKTLTKEQYELMKKLAVELSKSR